MTDRYDIRAKVAAEDVDAWHKLNEEARRLMLRTVLAERLKFACHFADNEVPVYNLVIAKGGLKMTEAKPDEISPWHFHAPGDPSTAYSGPGMTMRDTPNGPLTVFQRMDMALRRPGGRRIRTNRPSRHLHRAAEAAWATAGTRPRFGTTTHCRPR
jgi:uncharacterized protein (TIGR03435 family)